MYPAPATTQTFVNPVRLSGGDESPPYEPTQKFPGSGAGLAMPPIKPGLEFLCLFFARHPLPAPARTMPCRPYPRFGVSLPVFCKAPASGSGANNAVPPLPPVQSFFAYFLCKESRAVFISSSWAGTSVRSMAEKSVVTPASSSSPCWAAGSSQISRAQR